MRALWMAGLLVGCGGGGSGGVDEEDIVPPSCGWNEAALRGVIDGEDVDLVIDLDNHAFSRFGSFDAQGDGEIGLYWDGEVADGDTVEGWGFVDLGATWYGTCEGSDDPSEITFTVAPDSFDEDPTGTFVLRDVHRDEACEEPARGLLLGCFG